MLECFLTKFGIFSACMLVFTIMNYHLHIRFQNRVIFSEFHYFLIDPCTQKSLNLQILVLHNYKFCFLSTFQVRRYGC